MILGAKILEKGCSLYVIKHDDLLTQKGCRMHPHEPGKVLLPVTNELDLLGGHQRLHN